MLYNLIYMWFNKICEQFFIIDILDSIGNYIIFVNIIAIH